MFLPMNELSIRQMRREDLDTAVAWAAREGWNPGLHDTPVFWETDPEGYWAAEVGGELVGTGSMVSYGGEYGFIGFFIVAPEHRHERIGFPHLGQALLKAARERLKPGAAVGIDGVFAAQDAYARYGFTFSHRNLRMEGTGKASTPAGYLTELSMVPYEMVAEYDQRHFGYAREVFLRPWISPPAGLALGAVRDGQLCGYGVVRQCQSGYKIGPLFADDARIADDLYGALSDRAFGEPVYLDTPESNLDALELAQRHGLKEVFGCARMYLGPAPALPWASIYGVTTFELG